MVPSQEAYGNFAIAAYENSQDLADEAELLMRLGKHARACALAVLAAEEFAKAFLCRCYSIGIINDPDFSRDLTQHDIKLVHFVKIISGYALLSKHKREIDEAYRLNRILKNDQLLIDTLNKIATREKQHIQDTVDVFAQGDLIKQSGFYTDIDGEEIIKPSEIITKQRAKVVLSYLPATRGFGWVLELPDQEFRNAVDILDYEVTYGSIKLFVRPRKKRAEFHAALRRKE